MVASAASGSFAGSGRPGQLACRLHAVLVSGGENQPGRRVAQRQRHGDPAVEARSPDVREEGVVVVPVQQGSDSNTLRVLDGDPLPLHRVYLRAAQLALRVEEAQTVAGVQREARGDGQLAPPHALHATHFLAHHLRGGRERDRLGATVEEIGGVAAIERLARVGREADMGCARRAPGKTGPAQGGIQPRAVMRDQVGDVRQVLQPPLDLERGDAGVQQRREMLGQVEIPQREQVAPLGQDAAAGVQQPVRLPAGLGALAAVAAAPAEGVAQAALAAVADAEGAVDEALQLDRGSGLADGPDLVEAELAGEDGAAETDLLQEGHLGGGVVVHLGAGDERQRRQVAFEQAGVLDDQAVGPDLVELPGQPLRLRELAVGENRVDGDVDASPVLVGVRHERGDVVERVSGGLARAEPVRSDVHGIGPAGDGGPAACEVAGRRQELRGRPLGPVRRGMPVHAALQGKTARAIRSGRIRLRRIGVRSRRSESGPNQTSSAISAEGVGWPRSRPR